jgi:hypothetical protein
MRIKTVVFLLTALIWIIAACNLPMSRGSGSPQNTATIPVTQPESENQASTPTQPNQHSTAVMPASQPVETATPPAVEPSTSTPAKETNLAESFPMAPDSQLNLESISQDGPNDKKGQFIIYSTFTVQKLVSFYEQELPKQGWTLRYTDPNYSGGVEQQWKKDNTYLSLDFRFTDLNLRIFGNYIRIEPDDLQRLPNGFPLPQQAELVSASDTSWEYFIPLDYSAVVSFYDQKLLALNWKTKAGYGAINAGEGDGGSGGPRFPAGVTPMPTPTYNPRPAKDATWVMPDGNEIHLAYSPHRDATILRIDLTYKQASAAGLPPDIPLYKDAVIQNVVPGTLTYLVAAADVTMLKTFYEEQLKAAGWELVSAPIESSGSVMENWKKGSQEVVIMLAPNGTSGSIVSINCAACEAPF